MKKLYKIIFLMFIFVGFSQSGAQMADSVVAKKNQITIVNPQASDFIVSAPSPAWGASSDWNQSQVDCPFARQNLSGYSITLYIAATFGHSNVTWAFSKPAPLSRWVNIAFVRDGGTTSATIPPGYIFCVTTNNHGSYWAAFSVRGTDNWNAPITLWTQQGAPPNLIYIDSGTGACYGVVSSRVHVDQSNGLSVVEYVARNSYGLEIVVPQASVVYGVCPTPVAPEPADGGAD